MVITGIVGVYVDLIRKGAKTLEEVPEKIRAEVKQALEAVE